jgi:hypothetical protein
MCQKNVLERIPYSVFRILCWNVFRIPYSVFRILERIQVALREGRVVFEGHPAEILA